MGQPHKKQKGHIRGEDLMTEEQFKEAKEKVKKYSDIQSCIDRLKLDKYHISRGVMYMTVAPCESEIGCCGRHEGFHNGLTDAILQFYDCEIERLQRQLGEL